MDNASLITVAFPIPFSEKPSSVARPKAAVAVSERGVAACKQLVLPISPASGKFAFARAAVVFMVRKARAFGLPLVAISVAMWTVLLLAAIPSSTSETAFLIPATILF